MSQQEFLEDKIKQTRTTLNKMTDAASKTDMTIGMSRAVWLETIRLEERLFVYDEVLKELLKAN